MSVNRFKLVENSNGELDCVVQDDTNTQISITLPDDEMPLADAVPKINVQFFIKTERNLNLSVDEIAKNGFSREVLYITHDQHTANGITEFGICRPATAQDIEQYSNQYNDFVKKYKTDQENKRLARILAHARKAQKAIDQEATRDSLMPLMADHPNFDPQTHMINAKMSK